MLLSVMGTIGQRLASSDDCLGGDSSEQPSASVPFSDFGLDYCTIPVRQNDRFSLIQSTDFFYPLIEDPFRMGKIACANVLSDVYASGVTDILSIQMMVSTCMRISDNRIRNEVVRLLIAGFDEAASESGTSIGNFFMVPNPWVIVGGSATAIHGGHRGQRVLSNDYACAGDLLVLTKPLGTQVAANLHQWMVNNTERWAKVGFFVDRTETEKAYERAISSMMRLNRQAALLMMKHNAKAATDVTGFGLAGHADNLVKRQKLHGIKFVIHSLPIIRSMRHVNQLVNNPFKLLEGRSAETSGGLLIVFPPDEAGPFCDEIFQAEGRRAYVIGAVVESPSAINSVEIVEDVDVLEVPDSASQLYV